MISKLLGLMFGPIGRILFVLLVVAATWVLWAYLPDTCLRKIPLDPRFLYSPENRLTDSSLVCTILSGSGGTNVDRGWQIVRLDDGTVLASEDVGVRWGLSPRGNIFVCNRDGCLAILDTATGRELRRTESFPLDPEVNRRYGSQVYFSADGQRFAAVGDAGVGVFETETAKRVALFNNDKLLFFDLSADGKFIVGRARNSSNWCLWHVGNPQTPDVIGNCGTASIYEMRLSPRGDLLAVHIQRSPPFDSDIDKQMDIWDVQKKAMVYSLPLKDGNLRYSRDGRYLLAGQYGSQMLIDLDSDPPAEVNAASGDNRLWFCSDDGRRQIYSSSYSYSWEVYDTQSRRLIRHRQLKTQDVIAGLSPMGRWVCEHRRLAVNQPTALIAWLERLSGLKFTFTFETEIVNPESGRVVLTLGDRLPALFDDQEQTVWTMPIGAFPGRADFFLEQWSLSGRSIAWWVWMVTVIGCGIIVWEIVRLRLRKLVAVPSPIQ